MLDVRWRLAIMLCAITTINYLDRQALSIVAPTLMDELGITNVEYGWITSGFLFAYAIGQLLNGPLIDRLGTKRSFSLAVVVWSIAGLLHAWGRGVVSFLGFRVLLGLGEAANFPTALKTIAEWFPRAERSMAVGILTVGPGLGSVLAPPLLGFLAYTYGWQAAFIVPGLLGFVWMWWWRRTYHAVDTHPTLSARERALILGEREPTASHADRPRLTAFLRYRAVWGLMVSRFVSDGAFYFFVFWLPLYLSSERGFDLVAIGMFAWIPFLAADAGSLAGGWAGQRLIRRGWTVDAARKWVMWGGALMVPLALPAVGADSPGVAIALIAAAMFAIQVKASSLFALPADLVPARDVATVWGLSGAIGSFGGMAFNATVGWTIEHYSYLPVFACVAGMHILSAAIINVTIPRIEVLPIAGRTGAADRTVPPARGAR